MKDWAQREAEKTGTTPEAVLQKLLSDSGNKYEVAEILCGVTRQKLAKMLTRHGIVKPHCRAFEYEGITASFTDHCRRLGINRENALCWRARNKRTLKQAVEHYALGRQRRRAWKDEG